jgi:hypothetical protein
VSAGEQGSSGSSSQAVSHQASWTELQFSEILQEFSEVFEQPKELPPSRECDHSIPLQPGTQPANIRPYRLPYYQKDAMEVIVEQLLQSASVLSLPLPSW